MTPEIINRQSLITGGVIFTGPAPIIDLFIGQNRLIHLFLKSNIKNSP